MKHVTTKKVLNVRPRLKLGDKRSRHEAVSGLHEALGVRNTLS